VLVGAHPLDVTVPTEGIRLLLVDRASHKVLVASP